MQGNAQTQNQSISMNTLSNVCEAKTEKEKDEFNEE
jgi:hypothetical protein